VQFDAKATMGLRYIQELRRALPGGVAMPGKVISCERKGNDAAGGKKK